MRVFLTGASGFIGGRIANHLRGGDEVWALARSPKAAEAVRALGATPVSADLLTLRAEQLEGVSVVIHAAAFVEEYGTREQFWQANVEGTRHLLTIARQAGVGRFIHIGTEAALFVGEDLLDLDESLPLPTTHRFLYSETKAEAERLVRSASSPDFFTLVLRPRLVWGPGDRTILPALVRLVDSGRWSWLDRGQQRTSTCHVDNLCSAVERALTAGRSGEAYFIADDSETTSRAFLGALLSTSGRNAPERSIPGALARPLAHIVECTWRTLCLSGTPPLVAFSTTMLSRSITVRTDKAKQELGYHPVITREAGLKALANTTG
jgi:nucleoside-diphosphate-sugar epimerase